jgi:hypothetical protein
VDARGLLAVDRTMRIETRDAEQLDQFYVTTLVSASPSHSTSGNRVIRSEQLSEELV